MKNQIYIKDKVQQIEESSGRQIEKRVCDILSEKMSRVLFNWNDSSVGKKLIYEILKNELTDILKEHENYCAEEISNRLISEFELKSSINDGYSLHAKQADIVKELKKKFNEKTK